jgi:hypothetical protein
MVNIVMREKQAEVLHMQKSTGLDNPALLKYRVKLLFLKAFTNTFR